MTLEELRRARKERRLTKEERARYCELWRASGLSKKKFCAQEGLVWPTFLSWLSKSALLPCSEEREVGFLPLQLVSQERSLPGNSKQLLLSLPNGLSISGSFTTGELVLWIKELHDAVIASC